MPSSSSSTSCTPSFFVTLTGISIFGCQRFSAFSSIGASFDLSLSRSILLKIKTTGVPCFVRLSSMVCSCSPIGRVQSCMKMTQSISETASRAAFSIWSPSFVRAVCRPGVSVKTSWVLPIFRMPVMRVRVVWGLGLTDAIFSPISALSSDDFPALVCPAMAAKRIFVVSLCSMHYSCSSGTI